jgi:hypothetical protein
VPFRRVLRRRSWPFFQCRGGKKDWSGVDAVNYHSEVAGEISEFVRVLQLVRDKDDGETAKKFDNGDGGYYTFLAYLL